MHALRQSKTCESVGNKELDSVGVINKTVVFTKHFCRYWVFPNVVLL